MRTMILAGAALFALAGCGDSTGAAAPSEARFSFSGAASGEFKARGDSITDAPITRDAIGAARHPGFASAVDIYAVDVTGGGRGTLLFIQIPATVGTHRCARILTTDCLVSGRIKPGMDPKTQAGVAALIVASGTVVVTELTHERIRGTFNLTMGPNDTRSVFDPAHQIRVTSGSFDVKLQDQIGSAVYRYGIEIPLPNP